MRRTYAGMLGGLPWWAAAALGAAAVVLGAAITLKPFDAIAALVALVAVAFVVIGLGELSTARSGFERLLGGLWIAGGLAVAVLPGASIRTIAVVTGVVLVVGGALRLVAVLRGGLDLDERLAGGLGGLARVVFGGLALAWPDITLLVLSLLVGPAIVLFGAAQVAAALRRRDGAGGAARGGRGWPGWLRVTGAAASLAVALGLLAVSDAIHDASPRPDAFYDPPADVPAEPGRLIRSEPFDRGIPEGARAWRILHTTTRADGVPAVASGIVLVGEAAPSGPRPVVAWAHGTTGYARACAPSLLAAPFTAGAMPALDEVVRRGWVLVATDYTGLGAPAPHPYLVGDPAGRSVLDAVRAAREMDDPDLGTRTVVWGHSQGGGAALWTGGIAPSYAPDAGVAGVAALAPATELPTLFETVRDTPVGRIMGSYVVSAYADTYPDVRFDDYIRPQARVLARETAGRCLSGPEVLVSVGTALGEEGWFARNPATGPLGRRLAENVPTLPIPAPLLVGQGLADVLVLPDAQRAWVDARCAAGQQVDYRTYRGLDHVGLVLDPGSPAPADLVAWTEDRFAGRPVPPGCRTTVR